MGGGSNKINRIKNAKVEKIYLDFFNFGVA